MFDQTSWEDEGVHELSPGSLDALLGNRIAAIGVPSFASADECAALVAAVDEELFLYSPLQAPPIGRLGITQYSHCKGPPERYFAALEDARAPVRRIFGRSFDPVARLMARVRQMCASHVEIARSEEHGEYGAGLVRVIHEYAGLHFDFVPIEIEEKGWDIDDIDAQISWNLHVSAATTGGACVVYDRQCIVEHEAAKADPDDLLADRALVEGRARVSLTGAVGDVMLFNTRNYHEILPCRGGRRLTVSSFIGRKPDGRLVLWS